jgi:hypothetical protein
MSPVAREAPVRGRAQTCRKALEAEAQCSDLGLFRDFQRVVDLYAEVSYRAFELSVPEKQLNRPDILCASVDQRRFCPAHRMCSIRIRIETDFRDLVIDDSRVLPRAKVRRFADAARE